MHIRRAMLALLLLFTTLVTATQAQNAAADLTSVAIMLNGEPHVIHARGGGRWEATKAGDANVWGGYTQVAAPAGQLRLQANPTDFVLVDIPGRSVSVEKRGKVTPWGQVTDAKRGAVSVYASAPKLEDGRAVALIHCKLGIEAHTFHRRSATRWEATRAGDTKVWGGYSVDKHTREDLVLRANANDTVEIDFKKQSVTINNGGKRSSWGKITDARSASGFSIYVDAAVTAQPLVEVLPTSPFPAAYEQQVFGWISANVAAKRLPFCWRQSEGRGAGVPLSKGCPKGQVMDAGICYTPCKPGYKGVANSCNAQCPAGYRDDGLFCAKPSPATYLPPAFPLGQEARCQASTPHGCHQKGLLLYPKCKPGFRNVALNCQANCPNGWNDIGVSCTKPTYDRGVGLTPECDGGLEKDGLLCYPKCPRGDMQGAGPVCWQTCPNDRPVPCGAGCALDEKQCAQDVINMTVSPLLAAASLASLGTLSAPQAALNSAKAGVQAAQKVGMVAKMLSPKMLKLVKLWRSSKAIIKGAMALMKTVPGKVATMAVVGGAYKIPATIAKAVKSYQNDFSKNFADYTTPAVRDAIDQKFTPATADYVKRKWALVHLDMLEQASAFEKADIALTVVSMVDPTGLVSVVNAYKKPLCGNDAPFPTAPGGRKY